MAKAYLYDHTNNWAGVKTETDYVINSGNYKLVDNLEYIYSLPEHNWDGENVFAIACSVKDALWMFTALSRANHYLSGFIITLYDSLLVPRVIV